MPPSLSNNALQVEHLSVDQLKPAPGHSRTHTRKQIRQIAASIQQFGFVNPVLVNGDLQIIAGHGRVRAARDLGWTTVPVIRLHHLSEEEVRAYVIADNRLAELAGWDREVLAIELQGLMELDLQFDLTLTGFETPEIDLLIEGLEDSGTVDAADRLPELSESEPAVSVAGDVWLLGDHRLLCGDVSDAASFVRLMGPERAEMVITDPPYNVPIDGHVSGLGAVRHQDFAMASGEMSPAAFTQFLRTAFGHLAAFSVDGSIHFVFMDWRHLKEVVDASQGVYAELKNVCVWNKTNGGMGSLYRSKHELVFVFKNGTAPHINNVELGKHGRYRTNVWDYAGVNTFGDGRQGDLAMHPTVKPVALVADAIRDCSRRGGIVLDPFGGSGTTLIAAERTGRKARLIELDPRYVDVTVRRFEDVTGNDAVHADTGLTFAQMAAERQDEGVERSMEAADV